MTQAELITALKVSKPKDVAQVEQALGLRLRKIGEGVYRTVYKVVGHSLVIKFPIGKDGKEHSQYEYKAWRDITKKNSKYPTLKKYMPEIIHFDRRSGVMVMKYYQSIKKSELKEFSSVITSLMNDVLELGWDQLSENGCIDIHPYNLVLEKDKYGCQQLKIIDMGYFFE
jgi:hypothetical protein